MNIARPLAGLSPRILNSGIDWREPGAAPGVRGGFLVLKGPQPLLLPLLPVCQNCVELDPATLAGIIVTDVLTILLLALGVYCFAGHETGRLSRGKWEGQRVCAYVVGVHLLSTGAGVGCDSPGNHSPKDFYSWLLKDVGAHVAHADFQGCDCISFWGWSQHLFPQALPNTLS